MDEIFQMLEEFLVGNYDPLDFSYDFPEALIEHHTEIDETAPGLYAILSDKLPEICADYERGADPAQFIEAVKLEYTRAINN